MPVYEYQCKSCGHVCDALQKLSDAPLKDCPDCGKAALERLLSTPAFSVKGKTQTATRTRVGHNLDGGPSHSHDHGHSHSHGGHGHSHGPGCGHKH
jgi:putative FmdB family regulatory protein